MAILDVDRHILLDIANLHVELKKLFEDFNTCWFDIIEVRDKTESIIFGSEKDDCEKKKKELTILRDKIFKATIDGTVIALKIRDCVSKDEALINFLVGQVMRVDSKNGRENKEREV